MKNVQNHTIETTLKKHTKHTSKSYLKSIQKHTLETTLNSFQANPRKLYEKHTKTYPGNYMKNINLRNLHEKHILKTKLEKTQKHAQENIEDYTYDLAPKWLMQPDISKHSHQLTT